MRISGKKGEKKSKKEGFHAAVLPYMTIKLRYPEQLSLFWYIQQLYSDPRAFYSFCVWQYLELPGRLDGRSLLAELQIVTWYTYLFAVGYCHLSKSLNEIEWPKQSIIFIICSILRGALDIVFYVFWAFRFRMHIVYYIVQIHNLIQ